MTTTIAELTKRMEQVKQDLATHGVEALKKEFKAFFEKHPECAALRWEQYTPYFNDGEPCEFSVNDFSIMSKDDVGDEEDDDLFVESYEFDGPIAEAVCALERIDEEIFRIAFGDHVQVTATRDGFEVEEYDHE